MATLSAYKSAPQTLVQTNQRYVVAFTQGGLTGGFVSSTTIGVTASAFGDTDGSTGITAGTAKLKNVYCTSTSSNAIWCIQAGSTGSNINTLGIPASSMMTVWGVNGPITENSDNGQYSSMMSLAEGKVTVTLDNSTEDGRPVNVASGTLILEFNI